MSPVTLTAEHFIQIQVANGRYASVEAGVNDLIAHHRSHVVLLFDRVERALVEIERGDFDAD